MANGESILALDVGAARIGMALASTAAKLAHPAGTLRHDDMVMHHLREVCEREGVARIVIGLPRSLAGQETSQTVAVRSFGAAVEGELSIPISWQDEAVTSKQAEAELRTRGRPYDRQEVDALAATYILEDYLHENV